MSTAAVSVSAQPPVEFKDIDTNHDGSISKDEFMSKFKDSVPEEKLNALFDLHAGPDGTLSQSEMKVAYFSMSHVMPDGYNFQKVDANGDGSIGQDEWNNFVDSNPNLTDEAKGKLKAAFNEIAGPDGLINNEEFSSDKTLETVANSMLHTQTTEEQNSPYKHSFGNEDLFMSK